jgi:hypothetical protein
MPPMIVAPHRAVALSLGPQDDQTTDHEGAGNDWRVEQVFLDRLAERQPEHHGGRERDRHVGDEAARLHAVAQARHGVAQPLPVDDDHRQHRAALDRDVEHLGLGVGHAEQRAGEDQVPGRRDRQELGQPLDHAHHRGLGQQQRIQPASPVFVQPRMIRAGPCGFP